MLFYKLIIYSSVKRSKTDWCLYKDNVCIWRLQFRYWSIPTTTNFI